MPKTPDLTQKVRINAYKPALVNVTYILSFILVAGWAIGFFGFHAGNAVHLLLVMAMFTILVNIVRGA
ncbi:MAG TPA: lmo0937 family membrane protein [Puia sp.]